MSDMDDEIEPTGTQSEKRHRKLSLKGASFALEKVQKERSEVFRNASKIKSKIIELWSSKKNVLEVNQCMQRFNTLCENASSLHNSLLNDFNLPADEQQRQNTWFQEKSEANNVFVKKVHIWLKENEVDGDDHESVCNKVAAADIQAGKHGDESEEGVHPEDSVSNISSVRSKRSKASSMSSARRRALADQAALLAKAEALKRKHELEELEQRHRLEADKIRQQKEQVEIEAQIAAAAARLSVLEGSSVGGKSQSVSDGMNSYISKGLKELKRAEFNPQAKEFVPNVIKSVALPSLTAPPVSAPDVRPKVFCNVKSHVQDNLQYQKQPQDVTVGSGLQSDGLPSVKANLKPNIAPIPSIASQSVVKHNVQGQQFGGSSVPVDNVICSIMQKQNEITSMLVQQQLLATLPQHEIPVFDGNPLQCISFLRAFEHCVEEKTNSYQDCLYFLEQYTRGKPKELVRSCMHMAPQQGYQRAKQLIIEHFGNAHHIASAYMDTVSAWPVIKSEDVEALQEFALFLRGCCNAMSEIQYMEELNIPSRMREIIMKWPYKLRERWRLAACELQERRGFGATFVDMVNFLERQIKILSHPLFGDISDIKPSSVSRKIHKNRTTLKVNTKGSSFVTSISAPDSATFSVPAIHKQSITSKNPLLETCLYCKESHLISQCPKRQRISHKEKIGIC